jgi:hypothetical protein
MLTRRLFLGGSLVVAAAPAIVRASSLMPIYVSKRRILATMGGWCIYEDGTASFNGTWVGPPSRSPHGRCWVFEHEQSRFALGAASLYL